MEASSFPTLPKSRTAQSFGQRSLHNATCKLDSPALPNCSCRVKYGMHGQIRKLKPTALNKSYNQLRLPLHCKSKPERELIGARLADGRRPVTLKHTGGAERCSRRDQHHSAVVIHCDAFLRSPGGSLGRRWLQQLALKGQPLQSLLHFAAFSALISGAWLALSNNLGALTGGGGPPGGRGWGGSSGGGGQEGRGGPGNEPAGLTLEAEDDEEGEGGDADEGHLSVQPPFAHIGGVHSRNYEPKRTDEEGELEESGQSGAIEPRPIDEGDGAESQRKSEPERVYSDLPPNFVEAPIPDDVEVVAPHREDVFPSPIMTTNSELREAASTGVVHGADLGSFPSPGTLEASIDLEPHAPREEEAMPAAQREHKSSVPGPSVGNWFSGVFGALLGRRPGPSPAPDAELLDAHATAQRVLEMLTSQQGDDALAMRGDINALRRLQRETFAQLLEMRDRLNKLEFHTGLRQTRGKTALPAFASHLSGKTKVSGEVSVGLGLLTVEEDQSRSTKRSLDHAGLRSGTDIRINLETPFRTTDLLMTQLGAGDSRAQLNLKTVMYRAQLTDWLCVRVAAMGAQGADMAEALNPLEGQGLTALTSAGSALHRRCTGAAVAATGRTTDWSWVTVGHFVSGWGPGGNAQEPLCHATMGQITLRPAPECALAVVGLNRHWPTPSLPASTGLHWSQMGPLLLPRVRASSPAAASTGEPMRDSYESSSSSMNGTGDTWAGLTVPRMHGHSLKSFGFAGAVAMGELATLSGWAHVDDPRPGMNPGHGVQWGATLSGAPDAPGVGWGMAVGSTRPEPWMQPGELRGAGPEPKRALMQMEAFLNLTTSKGFTVTPGVVMMKEEKRLTGPAFMLRSTWAF